MEETNDDIIHRIETGEPLFNDVPPKPRIPYDKIETTIRKFKEGTVRVYPGNVVDIDNKKYHYYAQYNSGNTDIPWYGITKNVYEQLSDKKIKGIILIYIKTLNGNIHGTIQSRYYLEMQEEEIKTYGKEEVNRFLLNFRFLTERNTFVIEKSGSNLLEMDVRG